MFSPADLAAAAAAMDERERELMMQVNVFPYWRLF